MTGTDGDRERWVDELMGRMELAHKIGQLCVFGFCGPVVTPDVVELIRRYHIGGLRVTTKFRGLSMLSDLAPGAELPAFKQRSLRRPAGTSRDYADNQRPIACTPAQYAETLNRLRTMACERAVPVPLHCACDQEGNAVDDMVIGQRLFPHPMAYAAAGDPALTERCALALARQLRAVGIDMIHSPVLDVNVDPRNPEVGTRAYGDDPETVITHALATLRGFAATGLVATGKHFPGRGDSTADAHHGLPAVDCDAATLRDVHIRPFKALIDAGLPAIMTAHSRYPGIGVDTAPASATRSVIEDLLRGELGFTGVVETDNMMMGGVLKLWDVVEACIRTVEAGTDLVLLRDEGPVRLEVWQGLYDAVRSGRISEARIDASVQRILRMRYDMGLADDGGRVDPAAADAPIEAPATRAAATEIAERSALVLRDRAGLLPLARDARLLLVEQVFPTHLHANNHYSHPGLLWEALAQRSEHVAAVEVPYRPGPADLERVAYRLEHEPCDAIITTAYYYHKDGPGGAAVREMLRRSGKPLVVLSNSPYRFAIEDELDTVITIFHPGAPEHMQAAAAIMLGALTPRARVPVRLEPAAR